MAKGGSFENEICKQLSLWWSDGQRDDLLRRTAGSGGQATSRWKGGKDTANQHGDISFSDEIAKPLIDRYNIECKTGYASTVKWDILDLIDSKQKITVIEKFWDQCAYDAARTNKTPLLIFRRNGRGKCVMIDKREKRKLEAYLTFLSKNINYNDTWYIFTLSGFLEVVTPDIIKALQNEKS
jgi:hypothetical protein